MDWYYVTIRFVANHCNNEAIAAKCIQILHGFNYRYDIRSIGVSFPNWCHETVGNKISFVSTEKLALDFLVKQRYFQEMQQLGYFEISETLLVPADCQFACFNRCQKIDKSSCAGLNRKLKRLARRAEARGEVFDHSKYSNYQLIEIEHYHSLAAPSKSRSRNFRLNIQKTNNITQNDTPCFSSYGLANSTATLQSVPII